MVGVTFRSAKLDHCGLRIKLPLKGVKIGWSGQCDKNVARINRFWDSRPVVILRVVISPGPQLSVLSSE